MRRWWAVGVVLWLVSAAAVAGPTLRSGTSISVDVVACDGGFDCWLARRFVPSSWVTAGGELVFDGTPADFKLPAPSLIGHGETVGETPSVDAVRFDTPRTLAGTSIVPFTVDRSLNPDHYRGVLRVAVGETAIEIPTEIRVRRGPLLPLLCIIIGLALGMLSRWWSLTGEKKKRALDKLEQFASQISRDPAASIAILTTMLDRLREQVERGELDIDAELAKVMVRRYQLARVARFDHIERLETRVAQVRALISLERDAEATAALTSLEDAALADGGAFAAGADDERVPDARPAAPVADRARRSRAQLLALQILLRGSTMVLLTLIGMKTLYVDSGAELGAQPLYDYLVLLLWGLGSEIGSRSIADLTSLLGTRFAKVPPTTPPPVVTPPPVPPSGQPLGAPAPGDTTIKLPDHKLADEPAASAVTASTWPMTALSIAELDKLELKGAGTAIAVIDTGVDSEQKAIPHDRLAVLDVQPSGSGADGNGHGTALVALLASDRGVVRDARIVSIRALSDLGSGTPAAIAAAIDRAVSEKVDVIAIGALVRAGDGALAAAVKRAIDAGIVVVATFSGDAAVPGCISVASTGTDGRLTLAASRALTCGAPGVDLPTYARTGAARLTDPAGAVALVAGVCARLLSAAPAGAARRARASSLASVLKSTRTADSAIQPAAAAAALTT